MRGLSQFQEDVARSFLAADSEKYFALAGGGALLVHGISARPTQDLDFFTEHPSYAIEFGFNSLLNLASERNWEIEIINSSSSSSFRRVVINAQERLVVDLAIDSALILDPVDTQIGRAIDPQELAGRKILALYDRAAARDFVDVYALAQHFEIENMVSMAFRLDNGFEISVLAEMLSTLNRFEDRDIPAEPFSVPEIRHFFAAWSSRIQAGSGPSSQ